MRLDAMFDGGLWQIDVSMAGALQTHEKVRLISHCVVAGRRPEPLIESVLSQRSAADGKIRPERHLVDGAFGTRQNVAGIGRLGIPEFVGLQKNRSPVGESG